MGYSRSGAQKDRSNNHLQVHMAGNMDRDRMDEVRTCHINDQVQDCIL